MGILKFSSKPRFQAAERVGEYPIANILTRVLIRTFCPLLKSEIMFGEPLTGDLPEPLEYWVGQDIKGDFVGTIGLGADQHTLKSLARTLDFRLKDGTPNLQALLKNLQTALGKELEKQLGQENFNCRTDPQLRIVQNFEVESQTIPHLILPTETKFGSIKIYLSLSPGTETLIKELHPSVNEEKKIRVYASQLEMLFSHFNEIERLESEWLSGPQVRNQLRGEIKKLKRIVHFLKSESLESVFTPARKLAADLAREQGKQIKFTTHGTHLFLDKEMLSHLYEPVADLIRCAIEVGLETGIERAKKNKSAVGNIKCLAAFQVKSLRLVISDDGSGFSQRDPFKSIATLKTAREKIEKYKGTLKLLSTSPQGSTFELLFPFK